MARLEHITAPRMPPEPEATRALREARSPLARVSRGLHAWTTGRYEDAKRSLEIALAARKQLGPTTSYAMSYLAEALTDTGAIAASREVATRLVTESVVLAQAPNEALGRMALSNCLKAAGEIDAAAQEARKAMDLFRSVPLDRAPALASLASALLAKGQVSDALAAAREAMEIQGPHGQLAYRRAFVALVHAECLHAAGERAAARDAIVAARSWIESVASTITDLEGRRSFLENVVENRKTFERAREWMEETH